MGKNRLIIVLTCMLVSCISIFNESSIVGTYYANLPCSNCSGIVVDLLLEDNKTYSIISYPKNSDEEYREIGNWRLQNGKLILIPIDDKKTDKKVSAINFVIFNVKDSNHLLLLDSNSKPYEKDSQRYLFEKK